MLKKYELVSVRALAERVNEYVIYAPEIAKHCLAGQFVILRVDEDGERVPFTICDYSREDGTVCILVQVVGYTTALLARMKTGECLADLVGPLGNPTDLSAYRRTLFLLQFKRILLFYIDTHTFLLLLFFCLAVFFS